MRGKEEERFDRNHGRNHSVIMQFNEWSIIIIIIIDESLTQNGTRLAPIQFPDNGI